MQGKTIVATGATSGIGEKAVEALARQGARIVFVARDGVRAEAVRAKLERLAPGRGHAYHLADLSLMREVKRIGAEIAAAEPVIDALVNNAGAVFSDRRVTAEGLERSFALNHMSYFLMTAALLDRLKATPGARIVSTSSDAHFGPQLDFDDLQSANGFKGWRAYQRSKLANILFTRELARRLAGSGVTANCLHPGFVATHFGDEAGGLMSMMIGLGKRLVAITPEKGADTLVYLATSPDVAGISGEFFAKRKVARISAAAQDMEAARRLWAASEALAASV